MKKLIKWIKALYLYFNIRKYHYWYRESTNEWVFEVDVQIVKKYNCTSRYSHKYKQMCWWNWLKYFWSVVNDLYNI